MYELYGTYLTFKVKHIIEENGPIRVSVIAQQLAPQLTGSERRNLCKRIRHSINNQLLPYHIVTWQWDLSGNIPIKTYLTNEESERHVRDGEGCNG